MSTPAPTTAEIAPAPCVYYDGACPLCAREIATYRSARGGEQLNWVDAQACASQGLGPALARDDALRRLHVRLADGRLVSGAAAFVAIWQRLPAFRGLALLARVPGMLWLMEGLYRAFLRLRPLWRAAPPAAATAWTGWPAALRRELRTDHAGEAGAVMIYRGVLAVTRDPALRAFAEQHLATEARHLAQIEAVVPPAGRSRLLPLWHAAGWLTGALPALLGPQAVYATIEAVETFVDRHYAAQLQQIDLLLPQTPPATRPALADLRRLLAACQHDEQEHRDDARARRNAPARQGLRARLGSAWAAAVGAGSAGAVRISRWV
jgi:demethoxyubiquinone hydroxylase (CLK1/Coq7/Cat5 family)/predicted DCC family thiol-disulfide oxidoreductase YuxK